MGREDNSTVVDVSIMMYFTGEFKNVVTDPTTYIEKLVQDSNVVFENSEVPVRLQVHCIQELNVGEDSNFEKRHNDFTFILTNRSHNGDWTRDEQRHILKSADTAIILTATVANCAAGAAHSGPSQITGEPPFGWVAIGALVSRVQVFAHEIGHLFGCQHNREEMNGGLSNETDYGYSYLVNGTRYYTTMAYSTGSNDTWIPYFSSKDLAHEEIPIGDAKNDNRAELIQNRFLVSQVGDESDTCPNTVDSCAGMCMRSNAPIDLTLHGRELWCRDFCKMPSTGYHDLNGQAIGIDYDYDQGNCNNRYDELENDDLETVLLVIMVGAAVIVAVLLIFYKVFKQGYLCHHDKSSVESG